jgi:hypothetical protein
MVLRRPSTEKAIPINGEPLVMSTRHKFSKATIQNFCNQHGTTINLTAEQTGKLTDFGKTALLVEQIADLAEQMCPYVDSQKRFIEEKAEGFHPMALSLYVLNETLWKIMSQKNERPESMLPMTTIPWFYWEKEAEGRGNPAGVRRVSDSARPLTVKFQNNTLLIKGGGGDFCGLLEGRIVDKHQGVRPLFIPGSTGPKKTVPNYEAQNIEIKIDMRSSESELYPSPIKELDYFFSEHPRVFYEHGIQINAEGETINLKVGKRRETTLRGKVNIFIGKDFAEIPDSGDVLMFHVWLHILNELIFR